MKPKPVERTDPCSTTSDHPKARACVKSDFLCNDNEQQETGKTEEKRLHVMKKLHLKGTSFLRSEERLEQKKYVISYYKKKIQNPLPFKDGRK